MTNTETLSPLDAFLVRVLCSITAMAWLLALFCGSVAAATGRLEPLGGLAPALLVAVPLTVLVLRHDR